MTLPSRQRIRTLAVWGRVRYLTGHGGSAQYWIFTSERGRNISFLFECQRGGRVPEFPSRFNHSARAPNVLRGWQWDDSARVLFQCRTACPGVSTTSAHYYSVLWVCRVAGDTAAIPQPPIHPPGRNNTYYLNARRAVNDLKVRLPPNPWLILPSKTLTRRSLYLVGCKSPQAAVTCS